MNELTDDQICDIARSTQTAEPGRDGYILPVAFARAVIAAHRGQQDHEIERLRADAARYQWLMSNADNDIKTTGNSAAPTLYAGGVNFSRPGWDSQITDAIDAAIKVATP